MIEDLIKIVKVVFNIAAYLISIVPELHLLLRQLNGLIYVELMLLNQLLLLL